MIQRIMTKEEKQAKEMRNKRILATIIGLVMLFSTASYAFFSFDSSTTKKEKIDFNGISFQKNDNELWDFTINEQAFQTRFNPNEVQNISIQTAKTFDNYYGKPLYFGINSIEEASNLGNSEIIRNIGNYLSKEQLSCLNENCTENYPIKNCSSENVIVFREANISRIYDEDDCLILNYAAYEEERVSDAFLFRILGIT